MTVTETLAVELSVIGTKATPWFGLQTNRCGWWIKGGEVSLYEKLKIVLSLPERQLVDIGNVEKNGSKKITHRKLLAKNARSISVDRKWR